MEHSDSDEFGMIAIQSDGSFTYDGVTVSITSEYVSVDLTGQPDVVIRRIEGQAE